MIESVPTFWVDDDENILDVTFTEWERNEEGGWNLIEDQTHTPPDGVARVIFELPIGCFYTDVRPTKGESVTLYGVPGGHLPRCVRIQVEEWAGLWT